MMRKHIVLGYAIGAGLTPTEIGKVLRISHNNAAVTLSRALKEHGISNEAVTKSPRDGSIKRVIIEALRKGIPPAWVAYELGKPLPQVTSLFAYYRRLDKTLPRYQFKTGRSPANKWIRDWEAFKKERGI